MDPLSSVVRAAIVAEGRFVKNWGQTPFSPLYKIYHPPGIDQSGARVTASSQPAMSSGFSLPFHPAPYLVRARDIMFRQ